jgi:hypothetical protein
MKFKLTLVASEDDGVAFITAVDVTIPVDQLEGEGTLGGAVGVILERLTEKGISVA